MFDALINVVGISPDAVVSDGAPPHVQIRLTTGAIVPQESGAAVLPIGVLKFVLDKEDAVRFAEELRSEAESLPEQKQSDIMIASNLSEVEKAAEQINRVVGK